MSVRKTLLALIHQHRLDNFTISDLKSICTGLITATSSKHLGIKIYKQVWVLSQEGVLTVSKHPTEPQKNTYSLSDNGQQLAETMNTAAIPTANNKRPDLVALHRKLNDYSTALASAVQRHRSIRSCPVNSQSLSILFSQNSCQQKNVPLCIRGVCLP